MILYDGEGVIKVPNQLYKLTKPGRIVVNVNGQKGIFRLDISKIIPQNYIKNIRVVPITQEETYVQKRWNPSFLARWQGVACLRFMDVMQTNGSQQTVWQKRPKPTDASFASKGVPIEWLVYLANQVNCDAWFCMPHYADDDYIKQFASYVNENLKPNLRAWLEYSNEVWNGGFQQSKYASQMGLQQKLSSKPYEATFKYYAYRSMQIFKIWTDTFNGHDRFVRVLASQAANQYATEQILSYQDVASQADVLAIAPYVTFSVSSTSEDGTNDKLVSTWSLDKLFEHINRICLPESTQWIKNSKKLADDYGLKLVAYEAGQHLVGVGGAENNEKLNTLLIAANSDVRMGDIYTKSLNIWVQVGGDFTCSYNSVGSWSKWGSWGLLQYHDETIASSPKLLSSVKWAISRGQNDLITF